MTTLAWFLAMVGTADWVRGGVSDALLGRRCWSIVAAAMVAILGFWGLGRTVHDIWLPLVGIVLVTVWIFADRLPVKSGEHIALGLLACAVLALLGFGQHLSPSHGWLQDWYSGLAIEGLRNVPFDHFFLAASCFLCLQDTGNFIVRLVLNGADPGSWLRQKHSGAAVSWVRLSAALFSQWLWQGNSLRSAL